MCNWNWATIMGIIICGLMALAVLWMFWMPGSEGED